MFKKSLVFPGLVLLFFYLLSFAGQGSLLEISSLRHHIHPNFTRIVLDLGILREYNSGELQSPAGIYVDIYQVKLNPILEGKTIPVRNDYLSQVRITQKTPSTVRVTAELDLAKVKHYRVFHLFDPFRVVMDIYPQEPSDTSSASTSQPARPAQSGYSMVRQLGLGVRRIVIDPGHGGTDPGCIGRTGLKEKDVVLDVALALKKLLSQQKGLEVILTRETDIFIPLEDRTVIANQKKADLFISIHANSSYNRNRTGIETFYLNFSPDPAVNEIAARENATSTKNINEMQQIIKKIVQNSKIVESRELAGMVHGNMIQALSHDYKDIRNLGVKGGPFWVLIGGEMPSILVEISHLSNTQEEQRLKSPGYRQMIARGIHEGIMKYIQSLGKGR